MAEAGAFQRTRILLQVMQESPNRLAKEIAPHHRKRFLFERFVSIRKSTTSDSAPCSVYHEYGFRLSTSLPLRPHSRAPLHNE